LLRAYAHDADALASNRGHGDLSANEARAKIHDAEAHAVSSALGGSGALDGQSLAVVGDLELQTLRAALETDANLAGAGMFHRVVHGFLGDAIQVDGDRRFDEADILRARKRASRAASALNELGKFRERVAEVAIFERDGSKAAGETARLDDGLANVLIELARGGEERRSGEGFAERIGHERKRGEVLADAVVQIVPNGAALALADFQEFTLQPPALGFRLRKPPLHFREKVDFLAHRKKESGLPAIGSRFRIAGESSMVIESITGAWRLVA
jgi:hypothetical protein